ncbi:helix-turn-helix domain-containing protein [Acanthopleuribacter pedis]|uniref:Helix-turn-helix transcriptional regulator n=1 Tax=Acanthopleuribacter pedis TaxID=442870 RepID=A0A8J7QRC8_9BACT|nr:AraC family transcriptional regulator [Acanthopleuribacter pedis]MBO1322810.1 helix-turn-helix transcriptional regulator [Acanthopleuribacter pedis]
MVFSGAQLMCFLGAVQALQLGIVALLRSEKPRANRWFAATVLLIGLLLAVAAPRFAVQPAEQPPYFWMHLWSSLSLLVSPLIYFYVRASVGVVRFRPVSLLHFLPATAHLSLLFPLVLMDAGTRAETVNFYMERELYRSIIPGLRIGAGLTFIYWIGCFWWVRRLEKHILATASFSDQRQIDWLKWFTSLLVVLLVMLALGRLLASDQVELVGVTCFALFLLILNISAMVRPELFHGIAADLQLPEPTPAETPKYEHSQLEQDEKQRIAQKCRDWFEREKPYLDEELTLARVSQALKVSRNELSQVLNETEASSFYDYVNDYRIAAAKGLLEDPTQDHLSIDGIALEVGFRSRSVFYTAFKKRTNTTPGAWRKQRGKIG